MITSKNLQKLYTRIIGIFFVWIIFTLIFDYIKFGLRLETFHKIFHIMLGIVVLVYGWSNEKFWKPFCISNGIFFASAALFGFSFPNYYGLDAFNRIDTILHSIVGLSGLIIGFLKFER